MGEAKRRRTQDSNYGEPKAYMSYLEVSHTNKLVTSGELREMVKALKNWATNHEFYATVVFDHTERWGKIEKLCLFIGMEKLLKHNDKLYNTQSVFVTNCFSAKDRSKLVKYYNTKNLQGYSDPPPPISWEIAKNVLLESQKHYEKLLKDGDVDCIYQSTNCAALYIPSGVPTLYDLNFVEFFTKLKLQVKK